MSQIQSPKQFLKCELGEKFTRYYRVIDYFKHLKKESDQVKLIQYGQTYEERLLYLAIVSSAINLQNLEQIRLDNLRRAGLIEGKPFTNILLVWISYNVVHGNEVAFSETAIKTIYELVKKRISQI